MTKAWGQAGAGPHAAPGSPAGADGVTEAAPPPLGAGAGAMLWTAHQVAKALALPTVRHFRCRRRRLEQAGFPAPVRGLPDRWDPRAIEAWLAAQRPAPLAAPETAEALLIARARARAAE